MHRFNYPHSHDVKRRVQSRWQNSWDEPTINWDGLFSRSFNRHHKMRLLSLFDRSVFCFQFIWWVHLFFLADVNHFISRHQQWELSAIVQISINYIKLISFEELFINPQNTRIGFLVFKKFAFSTSFMSLWPSGTLQQRATHAWPRLFAYKRTRESSQVRIGLALGEMAPINDGMPFLGYSIHQCGYNVLTMQETREFCA